MFQQTDEVRTERIGKRDSGAVIPAAELRQPTQTGGFGETAAIGAPEELLGFIP